MILSVSPLLAASAAVWSTVSVWGLKNKANQENITTHAQERGREWEKPSVVSKLGGWPHAYFMISAPPVAFLWAPKHVLVSHIPSVHILCPRAMWQEGHRYQSIFLAQQFPHAEHWGSPGTRL